MSTPAAGYGWGGAFAGGTIGLWSQAFMSGFGSPIRRPLPDTGGLGNQLRSVFRNVYRALEDLQAGLRFCELHSRGAERSPAGRGPTRSSTGLRVCHAPTMQDY